MENKFYITTAIDYINDVIHVGHIYQKIIADVFARFYRLQGKKVFFLTGTDENGGKAEEAAAKNGFAGREKEFVDLISAKDIEQQKSVDISFDRFIRTTDQDHRDLTQKFWLKVEKAGDIYLKDYDGQYCEGCEAFINKSDLIEGKCQYHPHLDLKIIKEKNYFFRLSKYADFLLEHFNTHPEFVWPVSRKNEMLSFIKNGLEDIPISRQKVKWGIPVPNDPEQTIYVWFDALINYLTGDPGGFWPADIHILGKDNVRFHAILWPAMLKSAGYELPKTILVNGYLNLNGQKISKSLGNVIAPTDLVKKFGTDGTRYYFLRTKPIDTDANISEEKIKEVYNADLANGLGNLVARVAKLCEKNELTFADEEKEIDQQIKKNVEKFALDESIKIIWEWIKEANENISQSQPWKLVGEELNGVLKNSVSKIRKIAYNLLPFLPETAEKVLKQFSDQKIKSENSLFPRI